MHQYPTCTKVGDVNPENLIRKNRDYVPLTKCSGVTFGFLRLSHKQQIKIYIK